jgi:pilus assembly protein CpaE
LINAVESDVPDLRRELTAMAVELQDIAPLVEQFLGRNLDPTKEKRLLLLRLCSPEDLRDLERVSTSFPGWPIVTLIEGDCDATALYEISRAGASQLVPLPLTGEDLRNALARLLVQFGLEALPSRLVAVCGVIEGGATALAIDLADALAQRRASRCILVELSVRLARLAPYLNLNPAVTTLDLLTAPEAPDLGELRSALTKVGDHLDVLAGPHSSLEETTAPPERAVRLLRQLRQLAPVVVADMPYTFDEQFWQVLSVADAVVLVAEPTVPAVQALKTIHDAIKQRDPSLAQILVVNRYRRGSELPERQIKSALGVSELFTITADPANFTAALNRGCLLRQVAPQSPALADLRRLAEIVLGPSAPPPAPRRGWFARLRPSPGGS